MLQKNYTNFNSSFFQTIFHKIPNSENIQHQNFYTTNICITQILY